MRIRGKEFLVGILFAMLIALFINYTTMEYLLEGKTYQSTRLLFSVLFSSVWYMVLSMLFASFFMGVSNLLSKSCSQWVLFVTLLVGAVTLAYLLSELQPAIRNLLEPVTRARNHRPPRPIAPDRIPNYALYKHLLILVLNLLFFYIQRLIYLNQHIARRNEQLQLESVKSQHNALLQQINPHFFFNSINSLRYIILKNDTERAITYLDNLTTVFRKTLKASSNKLHTLGEEMALARSYTYVVEKRFEGKFSLSMEIPPELEERVVAPLSLLTLIENVVKHNKIAAQNPVVVKIYAPDSNHLVVENNIVPKFGEEEESGIGLKNLNEQYQLLSQEGIVVRFDTERFYVTIPLLKSQLCKS